MTSTHTPSKRARTVLTGLLVGTVCVGGFFAAPASAQDTITTQPYFTVLSLDVFREQGLNGEGLTIAMVDGIVDTAVPELQGADITVIDTCPGAEYSPYDRDHGTAMAGILVSRDFGWAPNAKLVAYAIPSSDTPIPTGVNQDSETCWTTLGQAINRALSDGADIVSVSMATGFLDDRETATAIFAEELNIPVVLGTGNDGGFVIAASAMTPGFVAVGAADLPVVPSDYSNYGAGLTIMAPGNPFSQRVTDESGALLYINNDAYGTSISTPNVAGLMALGMQKWPTATGNQLTRTLISTAIRNNVEWDDKRGYGNINPQGFMAMNPLSEEDTNPLMDKIPDDPITPDDRANYRDGLMRPDKTAGIAGYTYRGDSDLAPRKYPSMTEIGTSPRYMDKVATHAQEVLDRGK